MQESYKKQYRIFLYKIKIEKIAKFTSLLYTCHHNTFYILLVCLYYWYMYIVRACQSCKKIYF